MDGDGDEWMMGRSACAQSPGWNQESSSSLPSGIH